MCVYFLYAIDNYSHFSFFFIFLIWFFILYNEINTVKICDQWSIITYALRFKLFLQGVFASLPEAPQTYACLYTYVGVLFGSLRLMGWATEILGGCSEIIVWGAVEPIIDSRPMWTGIRGRANRLQAGWLVIIKHVHLLHLGTLFDGRIKPKII